MKARVLVFDNYDSFTYNLVHMVEKIMHGKVDVMLNDSPRLELINRYDKIILSPGPGLPAEAGDLLQVISEYASSKSILGVCLGHQAIGESFGARLLNLEQVYHGLATPVTLLEPYDRLFERFPAKFPAGRYHSWIIDRKGLPDCFQVTAEDDEGRIMAIRHHQYDLAGVQFHPESILTPGGENLLRNWLKR
jgi:anthranilate synthase component 2